jgi:hypothetical protein
VKIYLAGKGGAVVKKGREEYFNLRENILISFIDIAQGVGG